MNNKAVDCCLPGGSVAEMCVAVARNNTAAMVQCSHIMYALCMYLNGLIL